jgi:hypothetical protein
MTGRDILWYAIGIGVGIAIGNSCFGADYPRDDTVPWVKWTQPRPDFKSGFGPIIDDLESMSTGLDANGRPHPMRNEADPGNWVHEMTHQINSDFRCIVARKTGQEYNSFYVLNGYALSLPEPKTTLAAVAALVPKAERGTEYQGYLVQMQGYWNNQPFFILDEASAAGNALWYQVANGKPDAQREKLATEWAVYSKYLVQAVEKTDYEKIDRLRAFVKWNNARLRHLVKLHKQLTNPVKPYQVW